MNVTGSTPAAGSTVADAAHAIHRRLLAELRRGQRAGRRLHGQRRRGQLLHAAGRQHDPLQLQHVAGHRRRPADHADRPGRDQPVRRLGRRGVARQLLLRRRSHDGRGQQSGAGRHARQSAAVHHPRLQRGRVRRLRGNGRPGAEFRQRHRRRAAGRRHRALHGQHPADRRRGDLYAPGRRTDGRLRQPRGGLHGHLQPRRPFGLPLPGDRHAAADRRRRADLLLPHDRREPHDQRRRRGTQHHAHLGRRPARLPGRARRHDREPVHPRGRRRQQLHGHDPRRRGRHGHRQRRRAVHRPVSARVAAGGTQRQEHGRHLEAGRGRRRGHGRRHVDGLGAAIPRQQRADARADRRPDDFAQSRQPDRQPLGQRRRRRLADLLRRRAGRRSPGPAGLQLEPAVPRGTSRTSTTCTAPARSGCWRPTGNSSP